MSCGNYGMCVLPSADGVFKVSDQSSANLLIRSEQHKHFFHCLPVALVMVIIIGKASFQWHEVNAFTHL